MKQKAWTRLLALLLSIAMVMTCLPLNVFAAGDDGGRTQTITVAKAQLGTSASFGGDQVDLSNALYTFETNGEGYTISNTIPGTETTMYLNIVGGGATIPNQNSANATPVALTSVTANNALWFRFKDGSSLHFHTESTGNNVRNFNRCSDPCGDGSKHNFALFRAANEDETSSTDIPGYVRLESMDDVAEGGKYLIATKADDGSWYVLYPSNSTNKHAHVAKVVLVEEEVQAPVDKAELEDAIAKAGSKSEADYTAESWAVLQAALTEANTVYADDDATQDEVNAALADLNAAIDALEENPAETDPPAPVVQRRYFESLANEAWKIGDGTGTANALTTPSNDAITEITDGLEFRIWATGGFLKFDLDEGNRVLLAAKKAGGQFAEPIHAVEPFNGAYLIYREHNGTKYYLTAENQNGQAVLSPNKADAVPYFIELNPVSIYCVGPYTVSFEDAEGIAAVSKYYGQKVALPTPTLEGYDFQGWFVDGEEVTDEIEVTGNVTVTAKWEEIIVTPEPIPDYRPEDAAAAGYDVHYFVKDDGNGWTIADGKKPLKLYKRIGEGTNMSVELDTDGIDSGSSYLIQWDGTTPKAVALFAPYNADNQNTTAQGGYLSNNAATTINALFTLTEGANGGYLIQSVGDNTKYLTNETTTFSNGAWKGLVLKETGTEFFITSVEGEDGSYYIWYQTAKQTVDPGPGDDFTQTYASPAQAEAAGKVVTYLGMMPNMTAGNRHWDGVGIADRRAITLYQAAGEANAATTGTAITLDADGIDSGKGYVICIPDTAKPAVMHYGSAITNQCSSVGATVDELPHLFVIEFEDGGYTIRPVSETAKYLSLTASGSQQSFVADKTIFYITPANETNDGTYYIWTANDPQPGDAISEMLDGSADNTWVFTGGADVEGGYAQTQGHRNFMGHFEEYVRWQRTSGSSDPPNLTRQRYTINTAQSGQTLNTVAANWDSVVAPFNPRAVVYMVGAEDSASSTFEADLNSFLDNALALRGNKGFAVIIKSYDSSLSELNNTVDAVAAGRAAAQKSRILVVDAVAMQDSWLTSGHPNAEGHYELGRALCKAVYGDNAPNYPVANKGAFKTYAEVEQPTGYDASVVPSVSTAEGSITVTLTGMTGWKYEVRQDNGVTVSGSSAAEACTISGLTNGAGYTLIVRSAAGVQYKTTSGVVGGTYTAPALNSNQQKIADLLSTKGDDSITWLFMGDSITHGAGHTMSYDSVAQTFDKYLDLIGRPQDVVVNSAVSGATTTSTLAAIEQRLNQYTPDVVSIMIGTNDLSGRTSLDEGYAENLKAIIAAIQENNSNAIIILRSPTGSRSGNHTKDINGKTNTQVYCEAMQGVAQEKGLIYVDQFTDMQAAFNTYTWVSNNDVLSNDSLHPSAITQLAMSKLFIKAIGLWDQETAIANLDYIVTTGETSSTSVGSGLSPNENTLTLSVSALGSNLGQTTLTATNAAGQSWSVTAKAGVNPVLTLPDGTYTVAASSVKTNEAKTVSFAEATVELPAEAPKMPAPTEPEYSYEYRRASGELTEGTYAIVGTTTEASSGARARVMHPVSAGLDHCRIEIGDTIDGDTLTIPSGHLDAHLWDVKRVGDGFTFQSRSSDVEKKYLVGGAGTLTLGAASSATAFTVTPLADGGYNVSWVNNGTTYYLTNDPNATSNTTKWIGRSAAYKLNLYRETEMPLSMAQTVFKGTTNRPMNPDDPGSYFRIPSLVTLDNGWIMATSDIRWYSTNDSPNNLDTIVSISKDNGQTWEYEVVNYLADYAPVKQLGTPYGVAKGASASFIDPAVVQDSQGTIWLLVDLQPPYVNGGKIGNGFDSEGRLLVGYIPVANGYSMDNEHDNNLHGYTYDYYVDINNAAAGKSCEVNGESVTLWPICAQSDDVKTGYYADAFFNTYYDYGEDGFKPVIARQHDSTAYIHNNLFYTQSDWKAFPTAFIMVRSATVNETTGKLDWNAPTLLNGQIKHDDEHFIGVCPGRGVVTTVKGNERIVFALYDNQTGNELASTIYSDDHGQTWHRGERTLNLNGTGKTSESQIVVLPDGNGGTFLRMFSRNGRPTISYVDSHDGGATWGTSHMDEALHADNQNNQGCMVSFINVAGYLVGPDGKVYENLVMASYPQGTYSGTAKRTNGAIRIGYYAPKNGDGPVAWLNEDVVRFEGSYIYSCLTQKLDGSKQPTANFALLYETDKGPAPNDAGNYFTDILYVDFTMADLLGDDWSWVLEKPSEDDIPTIAINSITGSKVSTGDNALVDLDVDGEATVSVDYTPEGASVSWSSSDENVATVENGLIKAVNAGKALITAVVTNKGIIIKTSVEVVVQDGGNITLPDRYANKLSTATIPAKTRYELVNGADLANGTYIIYATSGNRVIHGSGDKTNHCTPTWDGDKMVANHAGDKWNPTDDLWTVTRKADGTYTIQSVTTGKYLTTTNSGGQLALNNTETGFTITRTGDGTYSVAKGTNYLAFSGGWKMQSSAAVIKFYSQVNYPESSTYTTNVDGLKAVIAALGWSENDYADDTLALVATFSDKAEADETQARIDALTKLLYRELRGDEIPTHTHTPGEAVHENVVEPTCTANGRCDEVVYCAECNEELSRKTIMIKATGHTEQVVEGSAPTCTETGLTAGKVCSVCEKTLTEQQVIPATGHTVVIDPAIPATETSTGLTAGSHCDVCNTILVAQKELPMLEPAPEIPEDPEDQTIPVLDEIVIPDPGEEIDDPNTPLGELPFIDVDNEKWYAQSIANVVAKGLMDGVSPMLFAPEDSMTRGMIARSLYALASKPEITDPASFLDLADGVDYADAVAWGTAHDVIKGYDAETFGGEDTLTREQLTALLYRYTKQVEKQNVTADINVLGQFPDCDYVSAWAEESMAWAVANELVIGRTDGTLDPKGTITRAEVAAILERYLKMFLA